MYDLAACPACSETERTLVSKFNRLVALPRMKDSPLAQYDYMLCHGCGLVYASKRPERAEYDYLYTHFNEFLVRTSKLKRNIFNESGPLTDELKAEIDAAFVPWWQLKEAAAGDNRVAPPMFREFNNNMRELPLLQLHGSLEGVSVLHIRTKTGQFGDFLRSKHGIARIDLVTLFPVHEYTAGKSGIRARACLDYERFTIPFEEKYDIIIANHLMTHSLDPVATLTVLKDHLTDGGSIIFKNELDDDRLFSKGANIVAELRPFHFQQFDVPTLARLFSRCGFTVSDVQMHKSTLSGVARINSENTQKNIGEDDLGARLKMYRKWRAESETDARPMKFADEI